MYEKFYGLREKPFRIVPNPQYLFFTEKHQNALTYLEYGLRENVGFILLTGEIGTGKTTLIRHLLNQIETTIETAVIFNTNVSAAQLLNLVLREFELEPADEKSESLERLFAFLIKKYRNREQALLIIDEAQNLSEEALEEVRMLSNLQSDDELLLKIMLVGQPELQEKLRQPSLAQLSQRIAVNYHLTGLTLAETGGYIDARLVKAGGEPGLFRPEAVELLHQATGGIPRMINILCDTALVYGFADELERIEAPVIRQVIKDKGGMGLSCSPQTTKNETPQAAADPAAGSAPGQAPEILDRLGAVEEAVRKLQLQMNWQVEELERRADSFKDDLVKSLQERYAQERQRYDRLAEKYAQLRVEKDRDGGTGEESARLGHQAPQVSTSFLSRFRTWLASG